MLLWGFSIVVDITQYNHVFKHGPVAWLVFINAADSPLNCLVDTLVVCIREKP